MGLALGALGVVFGDIGTSPLYAVKECFHGLHAIALNPGNVLGVLSLVFWSLAVVVSFKYVLLILRADNQGEGGIFALLSLLPRSGSRRSAAVLATLVGASLLYGDGVITPAISVLSAVEGLGVKSQAASHLVLPITVAVLVGLFAVQRLGTARVGRVFGGVMLVWFVAIGLLGVFGIARHPQVLEALDPRWAARFFLENGVHGIVVLGSVVLAITGAEALYADLGHFGRRPIQRAWFGLVFPALVLNYFGQGGALLEDPKHAPNPFYALVPDALMYPMILLATLATIIASQALITGVFSLTSQAVQMGFLPRVRVIHTSGKTAGQIFVPTVNRFLAVACVGLVLTFQHSSRLASAYGLAVTANMVITSFLFALVLRRTKGWSPARTVSLLVLFLVFDLSYFGANLLKIADGGWFPLLVATALVVVMTTWRDGRLLLRSQIVGRRLPLQMFVDDVVRSAPPRVQGTAVFMASRAADTPIALLHHFKHNHVVHQQVLCLAVKLSARPFVPPNERLQIAALGAGFFQVVVRYGFMETPHVPQALQQASEAGLVTVPASTSYFLGRETLLTHGAAPMARWRKALFARLSRNEEPASAWFNLPPDRVVELGMQIAI